MKPKRIGKYEWICIRSWIGEELPKNKTKENKVKDWLPQNIKPCKFLEHHVFIIYMRKMYIKSSYKSLRKRRLPYPNIKLVRNMQALLWNSS